MQKTKYSDKQKAQVALEAIKGQKTLNQISFQYQIHYPNLIKKLIIDQPDLVWATDITKQ
ncbi:MAG: hypothetical protein ACTSPV_17750 [Candidatus Hodarchaeales archaeon]